MTVDEATGTVFAPLADANRAVPGMNLYCNSLVALDGATGKMKWFHQLVHHDVWDSDMPTPPLLVDVKKDGRTIPAVVQTGKMNYVFIFDRRTGEPIHGMEERPVKRSDVEDDQGWPTQPFPIKPGPIGRVGMTREDINKLTPEIEKYCTEFWDANNIQPSGPVRSADGAQIDRDVPRQYRRCELGTDVLQPAAGLHLHQRDEQRLVRAGGAAASRWRPLRRLAADGCRQRRCGSKCRR